MVRRTGGGGGEGGGKGGGGSREEDIPEAVPGRSERQGGGTNVNRRDIGSLSLTQSDITQKRGGV